METRPANRRSTQIVEPEEQRRIVMSVALAPTVLLVFAAVGVTMFARQLLDEAARAKVELPSLTWLLVWVYTSVAVLGAVVLRQVHLLSHRVAGPGHRVVQDLRRIRSGDLDFDVRLRDGDFNEEIAREVNLLIRWLRENRPDSVAQEDVDEQPPVETVR